MVCNYRGTLINGTEFDSSYKRGEPATFPGKRRHQGMDRGPAAHARGIEVATLRALGSGLRRTLSRPEIGPDSTLIFEVELLSIQNKSEEKSPDKK